MLGCLYYEGIKRRRHGVIQLLGKHRHTKLVCCFNWSCCIHDVIGHCGEGGGRLDHGPVIGSTFLLYEHRVIFENYGLEENLSDN